MRYLDAVYSGAVSFAYDGVAERCFLIDVGLDCDADCCCVSVGGVGL